MIEYSVRIVWIHNLEHYHVDIIYYWLNTNILKTQEEDRYSIIEEYILTIYYQCQYK